MTHHCDICSLSFETGTRLANHKYDSHVDLVEVILGVGTLLVSRVDGKFTCPKCSSKLSSPTTFNRHLGKMHDGRCSTVSKRRKRPYPEVDNTDNNSNNDISMSISLKEYQMQAPHLNIDERDSISSSTAKSSLCANDRSILMASDAINLSETDKEKVLMLSKIGNWKPIMISSENGEKYHMLASQTTIDHILTDQPTGVWTLPT